MENEALLKLLKYFDMSLLQSFESKQFFKKIYPSTAKDVRNTILFTEFRRPIGSKAIKFLGRKDFCKLDFHAHQNGKQTHLKVNLLEVLCIL